MTTPQVVAVFDCNTFLQGLISERGPAAACLELFRAGTLSLALSPDVLAEVQEVLHRPELRRKFPRLTPERVDELTRALVNTAVLVTEVPRRVELPRDPKDEPYLNLAIAADARYLITRDKDLLDLMDEAKVDGHEFRREYPNLTILDPVEFLRLTTPKDPAEREQ